MTISFRKFIYGMTLFELYPTEESTVKVPCIFRVGPNRFIEALADPNHTCVRYMYHDGKQRVFVTDEKVEFTTKYCKPYFDAPAFLKERNIPHSYCDKFHYKWNKKLSSAFMPNSFLRGKYGVCFHSINWMDMEIDHSDIYFMENALTLCGKQVDCISWRSVDTSDSATSQPLKALIQNLLEEPHQFSADEVYQAMEKLEQMNAYSVSIHTGSMTLQAERGLHRELIINRNGIRLKYALPMDMTTRQMVTLMISLLDTENETEMNHVLDEELDKGSIRSFAQGA